VAKHGKKYREATSLIDRTKVYHPQEAIELAKKAAYSRFDETVELHLRMGVDPRDATQQVRGVALLPHGLGKKVRVLVFAQGEAARTAETAGADFVGGDDLIKKIEGGWLDFDVTIATPDMMGKVGRLGKILGRRGLMPNPKSGTVVAAKVSFEDDKLMDNLTAVIEAISRAKPSGAKGQYVKTASLTTTMGPGVKLDLQPTLSLTSG